MRSWRWRWGSSARRRSARRASTASSSVTAPTIACSQPWGSPRSSRCSSRVARAEAVGLADGDDTQPGKRGGRAGLGSQHDRPSGLTGVFDQFARGVDRASHGALEVAVVAVVELGHVVAAHRGGRGVGHGRLRFRSGAVCAPVCGRAERRSAASCACRAMSRSARPTIWGRAAPTGLGDAAGAVQAACCGAAGVDWYRVGRSQPRCGGRWCRTRGRGRGTQRRFRPSRRCGEPIRRRP